MLTEVVENGFIQVVILVMAKHPMRQLTVMTLWINYKKQDSEQIFLKTNWQLD